MAMVLNDEQQMLQTAAQEFFSSHLPVEAFRQARDRYGVVQFPQAEWQQMIEMGWGAILLPENLDGLDFGLTGMGLICVEAAKKLAVTPLAGAATLSVEALLRCQPGKPRDNLLRAIAGGEQVPVLVLEDQHKLKAKFALDGARLQGVIEFVPEGNSAGHLLLVINNEQAASHLLSIDLKVDGISKRPLTMIDRRDYARFSFDSVQVPSESIFQWAGDTGQANAELNNIGAVMTACELYGISLEAFERTRSYLCEREQFGQKIGAFQALQHRMAKAFMQLELLKSVLYDALGALEGQRDDAALAVSHAKVLANDTAQLVCTEAIQLHGGMGISDELDIGLFYKRMRVLRSVFGSSAWHRNRFARLSEL